MKTHEHLLCVLAEECAEVAQRVSKALRFGMYEIQPGQPATNASRIEAEFADLLGVYQLLIDAGYFSEWFRLADMIEAKKAKVAKFLAYSREQGLVDY